ncbi:MAG: hypothetical protein Q7S00_05525, partial [bacterium]|nr:hypothetical protein [bacterium]
FKTKGIAFGIGGMNLKEEALGFTALLSRRIIPDWRKINGLQWRWQDFIGRGLGIWSQLGLTAVWNVVSLIGGIQTARWFVRLGDVITLVSGATALNDKGNGNDGKYQHCNKDYRLKRLKVVNIIFLEKGVFNA